MNEKGAAFEANEGKTVDLMAALRWLDSAVVLSTGNKLKEPELVILKGTWRGLTYEQMADGSEYSTNYLMRDVAPKLWRQLSSVFGRSVGKTNFRVALEAYAAANSAVGAELSSRVEPERAGGEGGFSQAGCLAGVSQDSYDFVSALRGRCRTPMYGYEDELNRLKGWVAQAAMADSAVRAVGIWGLRGVGKTMLAERLLLAAGAAFDRVVWRSLQDRPALGDLCAGILAELGVESGPTQAVACLLAVMARQSVLLLLEDVEAILQPGQLAGGYVAGYAGYGDFFLAMAGARGCVVVTGIEGPAELAWKGGDDEGDLGRWVRSLTLSGLNEAAAMALLQQASLSLATASVAAWPELIARYQGHPLALKAAARVIRDIFGGRVDAFLAQMSVLFEDVLRLLQPSFERLCTAELSVLYWLASQDQPLSLVELKETLPVALRPVELVSALDSLRQRSLLVMDVRFAKGKAVPTPNPSSADLSAEQSSDVSNTPTFNLPTLVKSYAVYRLVEQFSERSSQTGAITPDSTPQKAPTYRSTEITISLGSQGRQPVKLSQWLAGQFDASWQSLETLFLAVDRPAARLRGAYYLRDETFVKRCKSVVLSSGGTLENSQLKADARAIAVLLMAIQKNGTNLYRVCVQAQPVATATTLANHLMLSLLDGQGTTLAVVSAQPSDSFIQLPFFQGQMDEPFEIELMLEGVSYREAFSI